MENVFNEKKFIDEKTETSIERLIIKLITHEAINQKIIKNKADKVEIETKVKGDCCENNCNIR